MMLAARKKRRRQHLHELGDIVAFAFHEPSKIQEVLQASVEELVEESVNNEDAWDTDDWWLSER